MRWSRAAELRAQVQKLWDRGELLAELCAATELFPKRLQLKAPTATEVAQDFAEVRSWINDLQNLPLYRLEMRTVNHRVFGQNQMPQAVWIDSLDHALALLGKRNDAKRFQALYALTAERQPLLLPWCLRRGLKALELAGIWSQLLDVICWLQTHPRPNIYLRQVDIPGIHSKFIESQRSVLTELLDLTLPPAAIDPQANGIANFAARYGFRSKPVRIRLRVLDSTLALVAGGGPQDLSVDVTTLARLTLPIKRVFITENEINFLAFPELPASLLIFGAGYGWEALGSLTWLAACKIYYWGDIDTHGFAILNQLRSRFPQVTSTLMDQATLMQHQAYWGTETTPVVHDLPNLTPEERELFNALRDNRFRERLRLEQELLGFHWVERVLQQIVSES